PTNTTYTFPTRRSSDLRSLLSIDSTKISSIEIKLLPNASEENVRTEIEKIFPEGILIKNRIQQNDALYKMLNTENIAVYLIFTLDRKSTRLNSSHVKIS